MDHLPTLLTRWNSATEALPWGVQRVLHDTLNLVEQGKVTLIHSRDYSNGHPCLINAVGQMLTTSGGSGIPMTYFAPLVSMFDRINQAFVELNQNGPNGEVSPFVAEVLLHHFAPLKEQPVSASVDEAMQMEAFANGVYVEPKDEDLMRDWLNSMEANTPIEEMNTSQVRIDH